MCVHKPNASSKYPGKTSAGVGAGVGVSLLTKVQPFIEVPTPKYESLEVRCQEAMVQECMNDLAEACLEVDHDMVCAMCNLTHAMSCANVGVLLVAGMQAAAGVSVGMGPLGEHEGGTSKGEGEGGG